MKEQQSNPDAGWLDEIGAGVEKVLDEYLPEDEHGTPEFGENRAAIFIAVERLKGGTKAVTYDIRGEGLALGEAIGTLLYKDDLPVELSLFGALALEKRFVKEEIEARDALENRHQETETPKTSEEDE